MTISSLPELDLLAEEHSTIAVPPIVSEKLAVAGHLYRANGHVLETIFFLPEQDHPVGAYSKIVVRLMASVE